jgi:hypothetical protein
MSEDPVMGISATLNSNRSRPPRLHDKSKKDTPEQYQPQRGKGRRPPPACVLRNRSVHLHRTSLGSSLPTQRTLHRARRGHVNGKGTKMIAFDSSRDSK